MASIEEWGAIADDGLELHVIAQRECPIDFKTLAESFMDNVPPGGQQEHVFFLSVALATAIIRLAAAHPEGNP